MTELFCAVCGNVILCGTEESKDELLLDHMVCDNCTPGLIED